MLPNPYLVFVGDKNEVFVAYKNEVFVGYKNEVGVFEGYFITILSFQLELVHAW